MDIKEMDNIANDAKMLACTIAIENQQNEHRPNESEQKRRRGRPSKNGVTESRSGPSGTEPPVNAEQNQAAKNKKTYFLRSRKRDSDGGIPYAVANLLLSFSREPVNQLMGPDLAKRVIKEPKDFQDYIKWSSIELDDNDENNDNDDMIM